MERLGQRDPTGKANVPAVRMFDGEFNKTDEIENKKHTAGGLIHQIYDKHYNEIIADNKLNKGKLTDKDIEFQKALHKKVTLEYKTFNPHVGGYYYIQMIHGTWVDNMRKLFTTSIGQPYNTNEFSSIDKKEELLKASMGYNYGKLATDIDIPQLNMEYESISGKSRNLNYASRANFAGDFSINYIENWNNDVFRYHEMWIKYIIELRKGNIKEYNHEPPTDIFMDIPYFNAVWVVIFAPFTTNIRGLIKIMGVSPINLPFKQLLGDRGKNTITTLNQNYKSTDMVHKFFESDEDLVNSPLYHEFKYEMQQIDKGGHAFHDIGGDNLGANDDKGNTVTTLKQTFTPPSKSSSNGSVSKSIDTGATILAITGEQLKLDANNVPIATKEGQKYNTKDNQYFVSKLDANNKLSWSKYIPQPVKVVKQPNGTNTSKLPGKENFVKYIPSTK